MEANDPAGTSATKPTHRRWIGVLLSLLIVGAGIFLAGNRKAGVRWFLGLTGLSFATIVVASLPAIPGLANPVDAVPLVPTGPETRASGLG